MTTGYSGTPLAKKLGIKEGFFVLVINAPANYAELLAPVPPEVQFVGMPDDPPRPGGETGSGFDLIHLFTNSKQELWTEIAEFMRHTKQNGAIWVSWYKKAAKRSSELTEDIIRDVALPLGLVDVKVCAVDELWSGLKLVIRRENRL